MSEMLIRYGSPLHLASHRSRIPQISQEKSPIENNNNPQKLFTQFHFKINMKIESSRGMGDGIR